MNQFVENALDAHNNVRGKLSIQSKVPLASKEDLSTWYTPGVAEPCKAIAHDPEKAYEYTWKSSAVAVVSDGSAVLGLGNIGGLAGLPVMEGKAVLMKEFADLDAVPIVLDTQDPEEIIQTVKHIAPTFGAINLEDIKAPECFYIEETLNKSLPIPVFHDDQHGTAIVVLAGLINALHITGKDKKTVTTTIIGSGAAGIAIAKLLHYAGFTNIRVVDSKGVLHLGRTDMNTYKQSIAGFNSDGITGSKDQALEGADIVIGVSKPGIISQENIKAMADDPIVFALSNPDPEITRDDALEAGAKIYASGRSDFPNQVNNLLVFPGLLRGLLDARVPMVTDEHKKKAAVALAGKIKNPTVDNILPSPLDKSVAGLIAQAID